MIAAKTPLGCRIPMATSQLFPSARLLLTSFGSTRLEYLMKHPSRLIRFYIFTYLPVLGLHMSWLPKAWRTTSRLTSALFEARTDPLQHSTPPRDTSQAWLRSHSQSAIAGIQMYNDRLSLTRTAPAQLSLRVNLSLLVGKRLHRSALKHATTMYRIL